jgi:hypothetical protein
VREVGYAGPMPTRSLSRLGVALVLLASCALLAPAGALAARTLTIAPAQWNFGSLTHGGSSTTFLKVTNTGTELLELSGIRVDGDAAVFSTDGSPCVTGLALDVGDNCDVKVTFKAPSSNGSFAGTLVVEGNGGATPGTASLAGKSISSGALVADPGKLAFAATRTGKTSAARSVTFRNTGDTPVTVTRALVDAHFNLVSTDCIRAIQPGGSCRATVAFKPATQGVQALSGKLMLRAKLGVAATVGLTGRSLGLSGSTTPKRTRRMIEADLRNLADAIPRLISGGPARSLKLAKFKSPAAGKLTLALHTQVNGSRVRVGGGQLKFTGVKSRRLGFKLTTTGIELLQRPTPTRIKATIKFRTKSGVVYRRTPTLVVAPPA